MAMTLFDRFFAKAPSRILEVLDQKYSLSISDPQFSPDGKFLACEYSIDPESFSSRTPVVRVWETTSWTQCHDKGASGIGALTMVFSPDSRILVKANAGYGLYLVDTTSWTQRYISERDLGLPDECRLGGLQLEPHFFSSEGSRFVMHAYDHSSPFAAILDVKSWRMIGQTPRRVAAICFSRDDALLLASDWNDNHRAVAYDAWTGRKIRVLDDAELNTLAPEGHYFGAKDLPIGWNARALEGIRGRRVSCYSPLHRCLIEAVVQDGRLSLCDPRTGKRLMLLSHASSFDGSVAVYGELQYVATAVGFGSNNVAVWSR